MRTEGETTYWLNPSNRFDPTAECPYCNRFCPRCRYPIDGGSEHDEQKQPEGASHVVCTLRRGVRAPMIKNIEMYFDHELFHRWPLGLEPL